MPVRAFHEIPCVLGQLVMSLRANRQNANAVKTTAYATAENAPRVMLSQRIGSTRAPVQANA